MRENSDLPTKFRKEEDQRSCNAHLILGPGQGERETFSQYQTCI